MYPTPSSSISLKQLLGIVKKAIHDSFDFDIWVRAEIVKLNYYPSSGHAYPELAEKEDEKIIARANAVIWKDDFLKIQTRFRQVTGENIKDGIQILFLCQLRFHEYYGLQLQIIDIDPTFTLGQQALQKLQTIERLKKENLFDLNKQIPLPLLPQRFAIISISTSRGFNDFMTILQSQGSQYRWSYKLFPAILEGKNAVQSITRRLREIANQKDFFDLILIIRGGGDETGLDCYDHYELARSIAISPLPVITGIGHSTNETIAEMVAAINKITPTDVAYFILNIFRNQELLLHGSKEKLFSLSLFQLGEAFNKIEQIRQSIATRTNQFLYLSVQRFHQIKWHLINKNVQVIFQLKHKHRSIKEKIFSFFWTEIMHQNQSLKHTKQKIFLLGNHQLKNLKTQCENLKNIIHLLNPAIILSRGYCITRIHQKVVRSVNEVKKNNEIETILMDGHIISIIKNISHE
ncbi:MAG: exodeoxyribonuclease VII large subunit [Bacteroidales bacterium]|nr:exodeoxyribonuclease VII large subunit [Bacteroidales bacterium]